MRSVRVAPVVVLCSAMLAACDRSVPTAAESDVTNEVGAPAAGYAPAAVRGFTAPDVVAVPFAPAAVTLGLRALLYHADVASDAVALESALIGTGLFTAADIDIIGMTGTPIPLAQMQQYACVYAWTNIAPSNAVGQGDRLKDYVDAGGRVILGVYSYGVISRPWELQGGIMTPGYSPLVNNNTQHPRSAMSGTLNFGTALTSHPILAGVTNFTFWANSNYGAVTLDPGATLIGRDEAGIPLIAESASGRVAGFNLFFGFPSGHSAGVRLALANACSPPPPSNQPPTANAGPDQTVEATGTTTQVQLDGTSADPDNNITSVAWFEGATPIATGDDPLVGLSLGTHTLTIKVTDAFGLVATDNVVIKVQDTTAPSVSLAPTPGSLWPPNHQYVAISLGLNYSDIVDAAGALTVSATAVSSEADDANGNGDGNTTGDVKAGAAASSNAAPTVTFNPLTTQLELRAERGGGNSGRTYTIKVTVKDASGNVGTATATVSVVHNQ